MLVRVTREICDQTSASSVNLTVGATYRIRSLNTDEQKYIKSFNYQRTKRQGIWDLIIFNTKFPKKTVLYLMSKEFREWIKDGTMVIITDES